MWFEVDSTKIGLNCKNALAAKESKKKWFPLNKGMEFRKWYGNRLYLVNWENDGAEMKEAVINKYDGGSYTKEIRSEDKYFLPSITWSALTTGDPSFRFCEGGFLFDSAGSSMFPKGNILYVLGLCNSIIASCFASMLNPTVNYGAGTIAKIPFVFNSSMEAKINSIVAEEISESKKDWNAFETAYGFMRHPLI
jgi:hypothetical protein